MKKIILLILLSQSFLLFAQNERLYPLLRDYIGEDKVANLVEKNIYEKKFVKYLTELQRSEFEVEVIDGVLYQQGRVYSSPVARGKRGVIVSEAIFVLSEDNKLYISHNQENNIFHHSSFVSGKRVKAAGNIVVIDGIIASFNKRSGHYRPESTSYFSLKSYLDKHRYLESFPSLTEFQQAYNKGVKWMPKIVELLNNRDNPLIEQQYAHKADCRYIFGF